MCHWSRYPPTYLVQPRTSRGEGAHLMSNDRVWGRGDRRMTLDLPYSTESRRFGARRGKLVLDTFRVFKRHRPTSLLTYLMTTTSLAYGRKARLTSVWVLLSSVVLIREEGKERKVTKSDNIPVEDVHSSCHPSGAGLRAWDLRGRSPQGRAAAARSTGRRRCLRGDEVPPPPDLPAFLSQEKPEIWPGAWKRPHSDQPRGHHGCRSAQMGHKRGDSRFTADASATGRQPWAGRACSHATCCGPSPCPPSQVWRMGVSTQEGPLGSGNRGRAHKAGGWTGSCRQGGGTLGRRAPSPPPAPSP